MLKYYDKLGVDITIESVIDDYKGVRILIIDSNNKTSQILFESHVAYRNCDESFRMKFLNEHKEICGSDSIYCLEKSEYLDWIINQSQNTIDTDGLRQFIIVASNDILEIISYESPIISEVDLKKPIQVVLD